LNQLKLWVICGDLQVAQLDKFLVYVCYDIHNNIYRGVK